VVLPQWQVLETGTELWRVYGRGGEHPTTWNAFRTYGPTDARFDHHVPPAHDQDRGILYAATEILTCVAEVFQDTGLVDPSRAEPWLVGLRLVRPVRLLSLRGLWPTRAGASMALNTGDRARARLWSRAIYAAYPEAAGLWYASAMNAHAPSVVLYERAAEALAGPPTFHRALADPLVRPLLAQAAQALRYRLGV
jgi:RES domain